MQFFKMRFLKFLKICVGKRQWMHMDLSIKEMSFLTSNTKKLGTSDKGVLEFPEQTWKLQD